MLTQLLSTPCQIVSRSDDGATDAHGNPVLTETLVETVCSLQQQQRTEPRDAGELSDTIWVAFLPTGTNINTDDALVVEGKVFEVVGDPWDAREGAPDVHHVEATLRRTEGGEEGS